MATEKKWYAVYTRARREKKVAQALVNKGVSIYCPLNRVVRQWSDRKKMIYEPLFTCYVFVHIGPEEILTVKETDGVLKFVYWLSKPAVIRDVEIEAIKLFLDEHSNVTVAPIEMQVSDAVRIVTGPLMQYEGNIISVEKSKVKVLLPSLGYMMIATVDRSNVELVKKPATPEAHIRPL